MRIGYFDCFAGASGDMIMAALIGAGVDLALVRDQLATLPVSGYELGFEPTDCSGIQAGQFTVTLTEHQHAHRHFSDIREMIEASGLTAPVKERAIAIFARLAEAEGRVHGKPADHVHFHEVGAVDSIVDIVGAAVALDALALDRIECSPVPTGRGTVECAHGTLPVPAPATAELLTGVPIAPSDVEAELTTPTGAAVLATVADAFGPMPAMRLLGISYGAGQRRFERMPNVLRLLVGETASAGETDQVWQLETNIDDATGEMIGYTVERVLEAGALDAFLTPIQMKKGRPGVLLKVLCPAEAVDRLEGVVFEETGTFGIRRSAMERTKRHRRLVTVQTPVGPITGKLGWLEKDRCVFSPEYEDCRRVALDQGLALRRVYELAHEAYAAEHGAPTPQE